ncbi:hypothetical protein [Acidithiobacillus concretivorus]|uniref:Tetratricopeptide repeat protein n=1 Tax=Acidithiobacillus concretivorus TaxID=3063952 RepID=A0ABS5ZRV1_9PROT|nr:hypothetical protein [Acidithiobacillus concretivorus]MBU2739401.1 hypothetical protein [Acidithiobacillus concretivorus]
MVNFTKSTRWTAMLLSVGFIVCMATAQAGVTSDLLRPKSGWNHHYLQQLMQARQAYWQGNPLRAIQEYAQLIHLAPQRYLADLYGEQGNVYYRIGAFYAAGNDYIHSFRNLIREKNLRGARTLIPIVAQINPNAAYQLTIQLNHQETNHHGRTTDYGNTLAVSASYRWPF